MFGLMEIAIRDGDEAAGQPGGLRIGSRGARPMWLRLFRPRGTRVAVFASAVPAQVLAMRAVSAGATVRVQSPRPQAWGPVLQHGVNVSVAPSGAGLPPPGTLSAPVLIVDDRPTETSGLGDAGPWQCRVDIRAVMSSSDLGRLASADMLIVGQLGAATAGVLARMMGVPASMCGSLTTLEPGSVALVARGTVQCVALDPSPAEAALLARRAR
jgi:hypothetical protein